MASKNGVEVTGIHENVRALDASKDVNVEEAGTSAARNLLPYVRAGTRTRTGIMRSSWEAERSSFINETEYAGYVEYGTVYITGSEAIRKAVDDHESVLLDAFGKEVDDASRQAGFGRI